MAWQDELPIVLRRLIADTGATPRFTDDDLEETLVVAARFVLTRLTFPVTFTADVANLTIAPDPTDTAGNTRDDNFTNLLCVFAAATLDRGSAVSAAGQAIRIKDGPSEIDLREAFKAKLALLQKGWAAVYEDMVQEYLTSQRGVTVGAAILSPFRLYSRDEAPYLTGAKWGRR